MISFGTFLILEVFSVLFLSIWTPKIKGLYHNEEDEKQQRISKIKVMNYYKIDRLTGFRFSFAVCVVVLYVFAGSVVLGVTITNCFFYLLFLE
jgi:hypothetical protein